jgi:hypothetical protein
VNGFGHRSSNQQKAPEGAFYFGACGLGGAFGLAAALGLGVAFGLATGATFSATGAGVASATGASTLYGAAASADLPNKNSLIFVNIMFSYTVIYYL